MHGTDCNNSSLRDRALLLARPKGCRLVRMRLLLLRDARRPVSARGMVGLVWCSFCAKRLTIQLTFDSRQVHFRSYTSTKYLEDLLAKSYETLKEETIAGSDSCLVLVPVACLSSIPTTHATPHCPRSPAKRSTATQTKKKPLAMHQYSACSSSWPVRQ